MTGNGDWVTIGLSMKILLAVALIFKHYLWVVSAFLPRAFSQEALTYFDRGFRSRHSVGQTFLTWQQGFNQ